MSELAVPEASHWEILQSQARVLAQSRMVPTEYRGKPEEIIAAGLYGRDLGLGLSPSLAYIHVIEGRPALSAEGMVALVRARGHSISGKAADREAVVTGRRADTGDEMQVSWTLEMAKRAGLTTKSIWQKYPEAMLWARAVSQLCRMLFADVLLGLSYTPDEVREIIDVYPDTEAALPPCDLETGEKIEEAMEVEEVAPTHPCPECHAPPGRIHATKCSRRAL